MVAGAVPHTALMRAPSSPAEAQYVTAPVVVLWCFSAPTCARCGAYGLLQQLRLGRNALASCWFGKLVSAAAWVIQIWAWARV